MLICIDRTAQVHPKEEPISMQTPRYYSIEGGVMPIKPKRPCRQAGCPNLSDDVYCETHRVLYVRENATGRGYDTRWRAARKRYLRGHPLCLECQRNGRTRPATVVDHILPHRGNEDLFWDQNNWQPLCKSCHDRKTGSGL